MKKKIVLHIGAHKTGSSSVQSWALANADLLKKSDVYYPETGRNCDGNHSALAWAIANDPRSTNALFQTALDELRQCAQSVIFISGEEFEYLSGNAIGALKAALGEFQVEIVLSLRPQHEIIRSQYGEWLKQFLTTDDFAVFWRFHMKLGEYDFLALLRKWAGVFGADNVTLLSHTESRALDHGMISSMARVLNLNEAEFAPPRDTNQSEPAEIIYLWRYMLTKLQLVSGHRLGVYDRRFWQTRHQALDVVRQRYGSLIGATRRMYLEGGYKVTRFDGYANDELIELQSHFANINSQLFKIAGRQLWPTVNKVEDSVSLVNVPLHAIRKADALFVEIVQSAKSMSEQ